MEPIVGEREGPQLLGGQMVDADRGNFRQPEMLGGFESPVAGDDHILGIDHNRRDESMGAK